MSIKVKICGLKTIDAVECAVQNGADFLGFVFFEKSPRDIVPSDAKPLVELARMLNPIIGICAVVVNPNDELLAQIKTAIAPDFVQIHKAGMERLVKIRAQGFKIIAAIGVSTEEDLAQAHDYDQIADYILFDAKPPKDSQNAGGFGVAFDWSLLNPPLFTEEGDRAQRGGGGTPLALRAPWFLSGGLNHLNVKEAIAATNANMVDVSSGVESAPGVKDLSLIKSFLKAAKG